MMNDKVKVNPFLSKDQLITKTFKFLLPNFMSLDIYFFNLLNFEILYAPGLVLFNEKSDL